MPETRTKKAYKGSKERVTQARLRLLAAASREDEKRLLPSLKRTVGVPAMAFAFATGFIAGFYPPVLKTVSQQVPSLLRRWFINQISH